MNIRLLMKKKVNNTKYNIKENKRDSICNQELELGAIQRCKPFQDFKAAM